MNKIITGSIVALAVAGGAVSMTACGSNYDKGEPAAPSSVTRTDTPEQATKAYNDWAQRTEADAGYKAFKDASKHETTREDFCNLADATKTWQYTLEAPPIDGATFLKLVDGTRQTLNAVCNTDLVGAQDGAAKVQKLIKHWEKAVKDATNDQADTGRFTH